jgi:hypothetical protein
MGGGCFTDVMVRFNTRSALYLTPLNPHPWRHKDDHAACRAVIARTDHIYILHVSAEFKICNICGMADVITPAGEQNVIHVYYL